MRQINDFFVKYNFIFDKKERRKFALIVLLLAGGSFLEMATVYFMLPFMYAVMDSSSFLENTFIKKIFCLMGEPSVDSLIIVLSLLLVGLYVFKAIYTMISTWIEYTYLAKSRTRLSTNIFYCIMNKPYSYHLIKNSSEIQRNVINDVSMLYTWLSAFWQILYEIITSILIIVVLFVAAPGLTLIAIIGIGIIAALMSRIVSRKIRISSMKVQRGVTNVLKNITQTLGGLKIIYVNNKQHIFIKEYFSNYRKYAKAENKNTILNTMPRVVIEAVSMSLIFLGMAVAVVFGDNISESLPILATFGIAVMRLIPIINRVNGGLNTIRFNQIGVDSVYETLKENLESNHNDFCIENSSRNSIDHFEIKDQIELKDIEFHYSDSEDNLYENLSLTIPAKKSVAFIGTTGSGKTTLADIILGLHQLQRGNVLVDGNDISMFRERWANSIGYIPQNIYLLDDSIRKNVAFGIVDGEIDDERVWECLEKANIRDFVVHLPNGLETITGENGVRISGGQKQRIGIARALYNNPTFLVMDEATSALDNETEEAIIESINNLNGQITMLIIAHRLTTIKSCDIIYKIENGTVEQVQYEELV